MAQKKYVYQRSGNIRRTMVYDEDKPDEFATYTEADMTRVIDENKALRENHRTGFGAVNKLLARVPMTVYEQSVREGWDDGDWKKWLNDPDNAAFRVWEGRI